MLVKSTLALALSISQVWLGYIPNTAARNQETEEEIPYEIFDIVTTLTWLSVNRPSLLRSKSKTTRCLFWQRWKMRLVPTCRDRLGVMGAHNNHIEPWETPRWCDNRCLYFLDYDAVPASPVWSERFGRKRKKSISTTILNLSTQKWYDMAPCKEMLESKDKPIQWWWRGDLDITKEGTRVMKPATDTRGKSKSANEYQTFGFLCCIVTGRCRQRSVLFEQDKARLAGVIWKM